MDDDLFRKAMSSMGVEPLEQQRQKRRKRQAQGSEDPPAEPPRGPGGPDDDDALFLASMEGLVQAPDKDRPGARPSTEARRLRPPKKVAAAPEATLDLHGLTSEQALRRLRSFLVEATSQRLKTVIVVTGKGLRSERGVSVVRQKVERWLPRQGKTWVRAYSEAPRAMGGRGAFLLHLR